MIKLNLSKFLIVLLIFFMSAFLSFAQINEESTDEAKPSVDTADAEETQAQIQQKLASITQMTDGSYSYNPAGKPDPFRPFIDIDVSAKKVEPKKDDSKNLSSIFPLQRVATENFRLVGIIGNETRRLAIVEDSARKFYPLFKGTHIGTKNGRVVDIMSDRVIVEEREENKPKRVILKLRKD
ncbi:MAG TPA: pilus assembly protein PilP [Smithellaceae bacterium]|nr:pilus assembly protein PilP [Smithellaceae bacterium]HRS88932.1 pilus assembly protein PilP [Smithellaceae bacterium]HRV26271.1 pilus assembly protein PilP [Smithellaceae bacterium]